MSVLTPSEQQAKDRAEQLLTETEFLTGRSKLAELAGKARILAGDIADLTQTLEAERSARQALQQRCEAQQEILGKAAYRALA